MKKKLLTMLLAATMVLGMLSGCGSKGDAGKGDGGNEGKAPADGKYSYEWNVAKDDGTEVQGYNFLGESMLNSMLRALSVELALEEDGSFALNVHGYMVEDTEGSDTKVGEAFEFGNGMYAELFSTAKGTYTQEGDEITITTEEATFEIPDLGMSYLAQLFTMSGNASGGSYNPEGEDYFGKWSSADVPEILKQFPVTTFKVDGSKITGWSRGDIVVTAKGDKAAVDFYADKTATYMDKANGMKADMTWAVDGEDLVLTNGEETYTGSASQVISITLKRYTSETAYDEFTQEVKITDEVISALQK